MSILKFNFTGSSTEEDLKKQETKSFERTWFTPGTYDLKIINAELHRTEDNPSGMSKTDPTWAVVKLTIGGLDARSINHYLLVPTVSDLYRKPGIKNPRIMFIKFREFVRGIGLDASVDNIGAVLKQVFADPINLVGRAVTVVIGHEGPHVSFNKDTKSYFIMAADEKKKLFEQEFQDADSAKVFAAEAGLELKSFTKIKRFESKEVQVETKPNNAW